MANPLDDFEFSIKCEVRSHSESVRHEGEGRWYVTTKCPSCALVVTMLMCHKFFEIITRPEFFYQRGLPCKECPEIHTMEELDMTYMRKEW